MVFIRILLPLIVVDICDKYPVVEKAENQGYYETDYTNRSTIPQFDEFKRIKICKN